MKIIHCADLHLGSKMTSKLNITLAHKRRDEILKNFDRLAQYAKLNKVDIILIAGDLLDTDTTTLTTTDYILNVMREYPSIMFIYLCGNHDNNSALKNATNLPQNLKCFFTDWYSYECGQDVVITGKEGVLNSNDYKNLKLNPNKFNIVTLHGQEFVGQKQDGEIINLKMLANKNIDYLALGHIHTYKQDRLDERGIYAYPGCLEGRGFDECGQKGFILLDIQNKKLSTKFVPFMQREFVEVNLDITGLNTFHQILQKAQSVLADINSNNIVRLNLCGTYDIETDKSLNLLQHELENKFFYVDIKDKSTLYIDPNSYINDVSLTGQFIKEVLNSNLEQSVKDDIITTGLKILKEAK